MPESNLEEQVSDILDGHRRGAGGILQLPTEQVIDIRHLYFEYFCQVLRGFQKGIINSNIFRIRKNRITN